MCWTNGKLGRPRSDAALCGIWSGSTLVAQPCLSEYRVNVEYPFLPNFQLPFSESICAMAILKLQDYKRESQWKGGSLFPVKPHIPVYVFPLLPSSHYQHLVLYIFSLTIPHTQSMQVGVMWMRAWTHQHTTYFSSPNTPSKNTFLLKKAQNGNIH